MAWSRLNVRMLFMFVFICAGFMFLFLFMDIDAYDLAITRKTKLKHLHLSNNTQLVANSTEQLESIEEFMKRYSLIHVKRTKHTNEMCLRHGKRLAGKPLSKLLVNEKHKLVFCQTPKVGSVSWCRIMLVLSEYMNYTQVMKLTAAQVSRAWKKHVPRLGAFPLSKQKHILANYTKFMFVRHPFTRLLSAFNDKMKKKDGKYQRGTEYYVNKIKGHYRWDRNATEDVEFVDFINMVVSNVGNVHWSEMYKVCGSCDIHYDVIGHFEDMTNDAKYILTLSNVTSVGFPEPSKSHATYSSDNDKIFKAFSTLPVSMLADLYYKFKYDFTLFDYKIPFRINQNRK
ncbi:carbohydrate sulfotransferase 11-like [Antedon mediterranea]|uniref:carbohydrate sulfotransferase 11-like n=1 Tax=Antedon mediterranea TaxID=105859 RepID=UPI003AF9C922